MAVKKAEFHGRSYDYAVSALTKWFRNLTIEQRAAMFGTLADEWCLQCGKEIEKCRCTNNTQSLP
jgi:hypothetical protein